MGEQFLGVVSSIFRRNLLHYKQSRLSEVINENNIQRLIILLYMSTHIWKVVLIKYTEIQDMY